MEGTPPLEEPPTEAPTKPPATTSERGSKKPPQPRKPLPWVSLRISEGHLWITDTEHPEKGITYMML